MMKRIVVMFSLVCILACTIVIGYPLHVKVTDTNDIALENIEALASGEGHDNIFCYGTGSIYCNGKYVEFMIKAR